MNRGIGVEFPDQIGTSEAFAVSGGRIYVGQEKEGVIYSDDYGKSWTSFPNDFPIDLPEQLMTAESPPITQSLSVEPPDELIAVGTTLFAKRGDDLYRRKAGKESWAQIAESQESPLSHRGPRRTNHWQPNRCAPGPQMKGTTGLRWQEIFAYGHGRIRMST